MIGPDGAADAGPQVSDAGELFRIGNMVGSLLEEAHASTIDVYQRAVDAVKGAVSEELRGELADLGFSVDGAASESELRLAQAQLVGWLNGLLLGLQAAAANQARLQAAGQLAGRGEGPVSLPTARGGYV